VLIERMSRSAPREAYDQACKEESERRPSGFAFHRFTPPFIYCITISGICQEADQT
jgi:hypothetical protein